MDAQKLGIFIAQRRKELGMTQRALAQKLAVTDKAVSKWERGLGLPDINSIEPLAQVLEVSLVELVQARYAREETITLQEADVMLADTIRLSKTGKGSRVVGSILLTAIAVLCLWLLWLLISTRGVVLFSVSSIVAGLIAWAAPIWHLTLSGRSDCTLAGLISLAGTMTSLGVQFFQFAHYADIGDWSAFADTVHALCVVVILFCGMTLLLNLLMHLRAKHSTGEKS